MAAKINLRVTSDFAQASADLREFGKLTEQERKRVEKFQQAFDGQSIDKFTDRNRRAAAAVTATQGKLAGLQTEYKGLQREIQRLIRKGLDPQDEALKPLITRYQQLEREIEDTSQASSKSASRFGALDGVMIGLGATLTNLAIDGFRTAIRFIYESADAASAAEETFSKFNTVFRDIRGDAVTAVEELAGAFDLADSTAARLIGNTADLLTGFGLTQEAALDLSVQTNELAIDLASFTNAQGGAEAVSRALTSAYSGEREALKTYGIVINEAMVQAQMLENAQRGLTFETEQQAKAFATLEIAQSQSLNAIGDYARTSDSAANTQRQLNEQVVRLRENLGEAVLEGLTPFRRALNDLIKEFNDVTDNAKNLEDALTGGDADLIDFADALADAQRGVAVAQRQYNQAVESGSTITSVLRDNLAQAQTELRTIEANYYNATRRAQAFALAQREAAEAEAAAADSAERQAQMTAAAQQMRLAITERYGALVEQSELSSLERIEVARQQALDEAAAGYVRSGAEIELIHQYYDQERAKAEEEILARRRESLEEGLVAVRATLAQESEARLAAIEADLRAEEDAAKKSAQIRRQLNSTLIAGAVELSSALIALSQATVQREIENVDRETQARLEALGLAEKTKIETLEAELAAAVAAGDTETANQKEQELARARIMDEAERKKAQLQYRAALVQHKLQIANAIATGAQAVLSALATQPFLPLGLAMAGVATAATGIQLAAIRQAKPQAPTAETGTGPVGITVPESSGSRADSVAVMASPGERIQVEPRGGNGMGVMNIRVEIDRQTLISITNRAIESGEIRITTDNIQGGAA